jgi:4'-phosphopantetheinyl transferase
MLLLYSKISPYRHKYLLEKYSQAFDVNFYQGLFKFHNWQDAQMSLLGRILLKKGLKLLGRNEDVKNFIRYNHYGKPFFANSNINFNISHSSEVVTCALIENYAIGIDIEKIANIRIDDYLSFMTKNERNKINNKSEVIAFFNYWTQKEAVLKAAGEGLNLDLKSFEIENNRTEINGRIYYTFYIFLYPDYICHIASMKKIDKSINIKKTYINVFDL